MSDSHDLPINGLPGHRHRSHPLGLPEQVAAEKHAADLATLRSDIVTKAITWLEADSQQAQTRAAAISNATPARQRPRLPCGVGGAFVMSRLTDKVDYWCAGVESRS